MKSTIKTTLAVVMLVSSSFTYADTIQPEAGPDPETTGSIANDRPRVTEELRAFCNSQPDDAKCRAENIGEINKGN